MCCFRTANGELLPLVAGDHLQTYYWFWLFKDNLIGPSAFFSNPYEFHIAGGHLQHGYAQFPVSILFFLLSVFGNVPAHNLLILLTYVFSGLSVYYLVRIWGSVRPAVLYRRTGLCPGPQPPDPALWPVTSTAMSGFSSL